MIKLSNAVHATGCDRSCAVAAANTCRCHVGPLGENAVGDQRRILLLQASVTTSGAGLHVNAPGVSGGTWAPTHIPARQPPSASPGRLGHRPDLFGIREG